MCCSGNLCALVAATYNFRTCDGLCQFIESSNFPTFRITSPSSLWLAWTCHFLDPLIFRVSRLPPHTHTHTHTPPPPSLTRTLSDLDLPTFWLSGLPPPTHTRIHTTTTTGPWLGFCHCLKIWLEPCQCLDLRTNPPHHHHSSQILPNSAERSGCALFKGRQAAPWFHTHCNRCDTQHGLPVAQTAPRASPCLNE